MELGLVHMGVGLDDGRRPGVVGCLADGGSCERVEIIECVGEAFVAVGGEQNLARVELSLYAGEIVG